MLTFEQPLLLLLLLPLGALVYLTWRRMSLPYALTQRVLILVCRMALFVCIIAALAGAAWNQPVTRQATVFVGDISDSTLPQRSFMQQWISSAISHKRPDDLVGIVAVGHNALVEQSVQTQVNFSQFESAPDTNYTDLAAGLRLAAAILPADSLRHIVLLTDGQQNLEDAQQEAQLLQQQGIRLDVVPLPHVSSSDARIDDLDAPTQLHTNEHFTLHLKLYSSVSQQATLHLYLDANLIAQQSVHLTGGEQDMSFNLLAPTPGFHTFRVTLQAPFDAVAQNDQASAIVNVQGPPHVLVIEGQPGSGQNIVRALQATQMIVTVGTPSDVPVTLDGLISYSSVVLADVPAVALGDTRMQILQAFVRDLGHGLLVSGGQDSYGIGGYTNTPLEQTLPVSMTIPQHKETPSIAVVLIVESLEEQVPINISKEATKEVVNLLSPRDQVGISSAYGTLSIPMQYDTNKSAIDQEIDNLQPNDPASYLPDLSNAEQVLQHTNAKIKHVILLGDGDAFDSYQSQVQKMANENITVSTVATNADSPQQIATMQNIAEWGKGRYYQADNPAIIPQILLEETERAARRSVINETFHPAVVGNSPILTGFTGFPTLDGYIATTPKTAAQIVLVSSMDDPVLAVWQYGLGRVAAWTSDALGLWTKNWLAWHGSAQWWANLVTWTLPAVDNSALTVSGKVVNGVGQISVDLSPDATTANSQQQVQAHIIGPDLSQQTITLQPTSPEQWEGSLPAGQPGAYLVQITWQGLEDGTTTHMTTTAGLVVPYSPEYQAQGTDIRFLKLLAQAGGGILLSTNLKDTATTFAQKLLPTSAAVPISFWLLVLAALLLPVDVAVRRLAGLDFLVAGYKWLLARIQSRQANLLASANGASPASATLSQLRTRREERRSRIMTNIQQPSSRASDSSVPPAAKKATHKPTPPATPDQPQSSSMAARLIEAKRKRTQPK